MLLDTFETQGLLFNSNFKDAAGAGLQAYRGDLVLIEGEVADTMGRRKPPWRPWSAPCCWPTNRN
jgi:hypothetical protein